MIGDREFDMIGAKAVGVAAIGALWGYGSREELIAARRRRAGGDADRGGGIRAQAMMSGVSSSSSRFTRSRSASLRFFKR